MILQASCICIRLRAKQCLGQFKILLAQEGSLAVNTHPDAHLSYTTGVTGLEQKLIAVKLEIAEANGS